ncbi:hypothetical protein ACFYZ9_31740 [Streptomyces sp. NPDC001691]|uniref:hypothetical protein n=1 Tax=unclassified Streptomyces TaxID=2593676 RepID=UPI000DEB5D5F|nr:hypothetical protein [Streptomyces sp. SDr-06]RCH68352.1 hypothetical protein DT019_11225 [Streptomyces sp. SDr-06]
MASGAAARGPGGGDLVAHADDLGVIGADAYKLYEGFRRDGDHARAATFEAARALGAENFTSGAALMKVHDTWQSQYTALRDACAQISNHLDHSAALHAQDDARVQGSLTAVSVLSGYFN